MNIKRCIYKILLVQILLLTFTGSVYALSINSLDASNNQLWHQSIPGILDIAEANDQFGRSVANGDFNGDGFEDLAIGVPDENVGGIAKAGVVNVIYGTSTGLASTANQLWHQNSPGIVGISEFRDKFGYSVAAGDFNGDGFDDLAIGIPFENIGSIVDAGAVNVIYGTSSGLASTGSQQWYQSSPGILGASETGDRFGYSLVTGDFNDDGKEDLAIGIPLEDVGSIVDAGAINVIYGTSSGLASTGNQQSYQGNGAAGMTEARDQFGFSLTSGDFTGNGKDDLAIGVPFEDVGSIVDAGVTNVIYGTGSGLSETGSQQWYQNSPGILGISETGDRFGYAVAHGDFNDDGKDDLAIGVPYENIGTIIDAGAANVLYGSGSGLASADNQVWHQKSGIVGKAEAGDRFGFSLTAYDFDGDGSEDLAIGIPYEDVGSIVNAGAVNIIYGSTGIGYGATGGLVKDGSQQWYQGNSGIIGKAETGDKFGFAVAAGNFDGDGFDDLAIGVPFEDIGSLVDAGVVQVLYGS